MQEPEPATLAPMANVRPGRRISSILEALPRAVDGDRISSAIWSIRSSTAPTGR